MFNKMIKLTRNSKGFTLIELVAVLLIIMIIMLIAVPKLQGAQDHARIATDKASIKTINNCILLHCATNGVDSLEGRTSMNVVKPIKDGDSVTVIVQFLKDKKLLAENVQIFFPVGYSYDIETNEVN